MGKILAINLGDISHGVAEATEQLGHDESAVASGREQRGACHRRGGCWDVGGGGGLHVGCDAAHRQHHVGAGIAIGDGEDV